MNIVDKLLKEKSELYDIIKQNYKVPPVYTGHCEECTQTQLEINNYKEETLEIPQQVDCDCSDKHETEESTEDKPIFF